MMNCSRACRLSFGIHFAVCMGGLAIGRESYGWGARGHEIVAREGSLISEHSFWSRNAEAMALLTNVPDRYWKSGETGKVETPTHWFEPDGYFESPEQFHLFPHSYQRAVETYDEETVDKRGTAVWRIVQFYDESLMALKKRDFPRALQMAGVMSHYIGDLSQPLHVTENYDGQMTGDSGIHKFFETDNLRVRAETQDLDNEVRTAAESLITDASFSSQFARGVLDASFFEVDRSFAQKDEIISNDLKLGRTGRGAEVQLDIARERLSDGAASLALILAQLWKESGLSDDEGASLKVDVPKWVEPDYSEKALIRDHLQRFEFSKNQSADSDDCLER